MTTIENSIQKISNLVGTENVLRDKNDLLFYSTDIFGTAKEQAIAVIKPENADELISLVKLCIEENVSMSTRGVVHHTQVHFSLLEKRQSLLIAKD